MSFRLGSMRKGEMLIDVTRLLFRFMKGRLPTGVDRVCLSYIRKYRACSRVVVFKGGFGGVFGRDASQRMFQLLLEPRGDFFRKASRIMASSPPLSLSEDRYSGRILFNVGHSGLDSAAYAEWLVRKRVRPVFMVHDLTPMTHPEFCRCGESLRHAARLRTVLTTAAGVVTNSKTTMEALSKFACESGWTMPPAIAAPLGLESLRPNGHSCELTGPYFVMLGTIEPRKNHWMALQVWRRIVERYGSAAPKLVVIGQRGWECENVLDLLERCTQLRGMVIELPHCSDDELACYLSGARALIFPSFDEGYGLPLIEALSLGVPVIAGDLPAFHEVAGNIPDYFDPLDGTGWMSCIEDYCLPDSSRRAAQLQRLAGFTPPTWKGHFELVDKFLEQIRN